MKTNHPTHRGFTLIELLTVIGIIGLLAAIGIPALSQSRNTARKRNAGRLVNDLHNAFEVYYSQFNAWPTLELASASTTTSNVVEWLTGNNPKRMRYMEIGSTHVNSTGALADPWGNLYRFAFDSGYTHTVTGPGGRTINSDCVVWSFGPDGVDGTTDDIASW